MMEYGFQQLVIDQRSRHEQGSFASNPEFKTVLTCIPYSDPLRCVVKCVLLSTADD